MSRRWGQRNVLALVGVTICLLLTGSGCGSSSAPAILVTPTASRADEPVTIRITGLPKDAGVQIGLSSTDARGQAWASKAAFTTDADGVVDLGTASASEGSYLGVSADGLITSMQTADAASRPGLAYFAPPSGPSTFILTAHTTNGDQSTSFTRTFQPNPLTRQTLTLAHDHISGEYFAPLSPAAAQPAVLILGGSEGGNSGVSLAAQYAARGIPALSVAYFAAPGLPEHLVDIPLEYFATALTWLGRQPGIDRNRVWVSGASYGSEAALILGAHRPDLVHGVITLSGGNTVTCSIVPGSTLATCHQAPFTSGGKQEPFTRQFNNPAPSDVPDSIIPVEKIKGPVLALCGGADLEWNSCRLSRAVLDRRRQHGAGDADVLLSYPDAGHYVDFLLPYRPINPPTDTKGDGATPQSNPIADADAWPKIIDFVIRS